MVNVTALLASLIDRNIIEILSRSISQSECKRVALYETWNYFPMVSMNLVSKASE